MIYAFRDVRKKQVIEVDLEASPDASSYVSWRKKNRMMAVLWLGDEGIWRGSSFWLTLLKVLVTSLRLLHFPLHQSMALNDVVKQLHGLHNVLVL